MHLENTNRAAPVPPVLFRHLTAAPPLQQRHFWVCLTPPRATAPPSQERAGLGGVGGHAPISLLSTWWQYWVNTQSQPDRAPALRTGKDLVSSWERMVMVFSSKVILLKPCRVWSAHPTFAAPGGQWQHCGVLGDVLFWDYEHASWIDLVGTTEQAAWIPSSFHVPAIQWKGLVCHLKRVWGVLPSERAFAQRCENKTHLTNVWREQKKQWHVWFACTLRFTREPASESHRETG